MTRATAWTTTTRHPSRSRRRSRRRSAARAATATWRSTAPPRRLAASPSCSNHPSMNRAPNPYRRFGELSPRARRRALWTFGSLGVGVLIPLLACEREMMQTGRPGIIPFELAGTPERAQQMMHGWGEEGRAAARRSLILDYPFLAAYAPLQAFACTVASDTMSRRGGN